MEDDGTSEQSHYEGGEDDDYYTSDSDDPSAASKGHSVKVITKESLLAAQTEDLRQVMEMLSVIEHNARTLLIHHRWNVENLIAVYVEKGKSCMFSEAGVAVEESVDHNTHESVLTIRCDICMDDVPANDATSMDCGHCFCNNCWTEYFIVKINDGQSKRITCMAHKCNSICNEDTVRNLVSGKCPDLAEKFDQVLLESYIEDNKMVKWCPSVPHCGNAIRVENDELCEVECTCGLQFCFCCTSEAHSPCPCFMWDLWTKKCSDETETVKWIVVHSKPCPKCRKNVQKDGGCNFVTCICGQEFCWLCGEATRAYHNPDTTEEHSCGRYKHKPEKDVEQARRDLNRYMHYYNRYKMHAESSKGSQLQMKITVSRLEAKELDLSWLISGFSRLFISRRALSYSYAFAFCMFEEGFFEKEMTEEEIQIKQNLFEDQQQQLEANVENLSKFLEEPIDEFCEERVEETRIRVLHLSRITDNLCRKMYECIEDDLLGSLKFSIHLIAPYQSEGIEKAVELTNGNADNVNGHLIN